MHLGASQAAANALLSGPGSTRAEVPARSSMSSMPDFADKNTDAFERPDDRAMGYDDSEDDSAFLDDPLAVSLQQRPAAPMPERPDHVDEETHNLVCATMQGGAAYKATRDAQVEALREKRLRELRERGKTLLATVVDAKAMLQAVRDADASTPVVIHVFSDDVDACARVDRALGFLAARQCQRPGDCRFVGPVAPQLLRLDATATRLDPAFGMEIDDDALPAVLVYRNRELVHHALNVDFDDADDVEDFLDDSGAIVA